MVQYYYDKFTAIANTPYVLSESAGSSESTWDKNYDTKTYLTNVVEIGYTFDDTFASMARATSGGGVELVLPFSIYTDGLTLSRIFNKLAGTEAYGDCHVYVQATNSRAIYKLTINRWAYDAPSYSVKFARITAVAGTTTYSKGALVQSNIPAEDGTYPANGKHTDGYWYVKGAAVGPLPPGTVINQPFSTFSTGGRKHIRLADGSLVVAMHKGGTEAVLYRSTNEGVTWTQLYRVTTGSGITDVAIGAYGNEIKMLIALNTLVQLHRVQTDGTGVSSNISNDHASAVQGVAIDVDQSNGDAHVTWYAKTGAYTTSYNIRYAKSVNGGTSWSSVENLTTTNALNCHFMYPTIAVRSGVPTIAASSVGVYWQNEQMTYEVSCRAINIFRFTGGVWRKHMAAYSSGVDGLAQEYPSLAYGPDGILHLAWAGRDSTAEAKEQIRYAKSNNGGAVWTTHTKLSTGVLSTGPTIAVDKAGTVAITCYGPARSDTTVNSIKQIVTVATNSWTPITVIENAGTVAQYHPHTLYDPTFSVKFGTKAPAVYMVHETGVKYTGTYSMNSNPTIALVSPTNNQTLYENDTINISGDAYDADKDQSVTAYYQINNEARKILATNLSQTQISLSKQLAFKGGKIYDGETALTGTLADGVAHTLKVWAEDSEKASSAIVERTFYVVPNRAPLLSIDAVVPSGVVDTDKFKISGIASDQDANSTLKVTSRINSGNAVEIYNGQGGSWEFDLALSQLVVGQNMIVIEVIDNFGAKTSKTIQLDKDEVKTPILQSVARYKITPPSGSAKGVLLFIERDEELDLIVELSMTLAGEQEQYISLTPDNTAPMPNSNGIVEDTYYHETTEPKDNIIVKLSTTRPDATVNHKIHLISGAVE